MSNQKLSCFEAQALCNERIDSYRGPPNGRPVINSKSSSGCMGKERRHAVFCGHVDIGL
jgi:hypothetical protein